MKETFGTTFTRYRKEKNFTQDDIAKKLNVSPQAVSKWENDLSCPDISLLVDIASIFNITVDELLNGKKEETLFVAGDEKKNIDQMILKVKVLSKNGDKVKVNLPMGLVKVMIISSAIPQVNGVDISEVIDFKQIFSLIEQGVIGKLVEVESANGDFVEVFVE